MSVSHAQLKAFHAVALHGGFSRAADKLCLSQPAVSDQIRRLESGFGITLFHRNRRQVRLTDTGRELLAITQRLFAAEAQADELLCQHGELQRGSLVLSVDASIHVLPALTQFRRQYPGIRVRLLLGNSAQSLARLTDYQADLAVVSVLPDAPALLSLTLGCHPLRVIVPATHPWAAGQTLNWPQLATQTVILREAGSRTRQLLEQTLAEYGVSLTDVIEVEGREAVSELVAAGVGVSVISAGELGSDTRLRAVPLGQVAARLPEYLVTLPEYGERRVVQAFWQVARTLAS